MLLAACAFANKTANRKKAEKTVSICFISQSFFFKMP
jgi:hypothetical protein